MAETAIATVLSKLGSLAASEAKALIEVGDGMTLLRDRLEWLQAFIRDADRKRRAGTDGLTGVWVRQTREVAFQAEDALDEFLYEVVLRKQGYLGWKMGSRYMLGFGTQVVVRHRLSSKINQIKRRLNQITENQKEYKIEHIPFVPLTSSTTAFAAWADGYQNAVGFDRDVRTLKEMILRPGGGADGSALMFISVVGESGIGKRTLGKVLSADKDTEVFDISVRLTLPPDFATEVFLKVIYKFCREEALAKKYICREEENEGTKKCSSISSISANIRHLLEGKRYLMMLGGVTSKITLNCLRASLPDDKNGSTVVLTLDTESEEVAWHANTMNTDGANKIHHLDRLDVETTGQLFRARAFRKRQSDSDDEVGVQKEKEKSDDEQVSQNFSKKKEVGKKYEKDVYDITGGYPLAIVVLAGLLRFKERPGQWEAVLQQLRPAVAPALGMQEAGEDGGIPAGTDEDGDGQIATGPAMRSKPQSTRTTLENVFWESFEDLTNDLKSCFLYFAANSKNTRQIADELVRMWIGEGFIKPQKGKTVEEIGHNFLKELVVRCLVEKLTETASGRITQVRLHPRLHGFLHSEAREAGFVEFRDVDDASVPPSVRRLAFYSYDGSFITLTNKFRKLRSFICRVTDAEASRRPSARVDDMKKACTDLRLLLRSKFLRVISVVGIRLDKLPDEIGALVQLRHLRVSCKGLKHLPSSISRLINLQTLDIRDTQVGEIDPYFWNIKALRHVLAECLTLPATIEEELDELQTLHGVKPDGKAVWNPEAECALHKMTKIRSLKLHGFRKDMHGAALESALPTMRLLAYLKLQGDVIPSFIFTAPNLEYLEKIVLEGTVEWDEVPKDVLTLRPNLLDLKLIKCNEAPLSIKDGILKGKLREHKLHNGSVVESSGGDEAGRLPVAVPGKFASALVSLRPGHSKFASALVSCCAGHANE